MVIKKKNKSGVFRPSRPHRHYSGIFDLSHADLELDPSVVSGTEMTGAVPAAREEPYRDDAFDDYFFGAE